MPSLSGLATAYEVFLPAGKELTNLDIINAIIIHIHLSCHLLSRTINWELRLRIASPFGSSGTPIPSLMRFTLEWLCSHSPFCILER
jgi:hypothetical protein